MKYPPGPEHLYIAGQFVRYYNAFKDALSKTDIMDDDAALELAADAWRAELSATLHAQIHYEGDYPDYDE